VIKTKEPQINFLQKKNVEELGFDQLLF